MEFGFGRHDSYRDNTLISFFVFLSGVEGRKKKGCRFSDCPNDSPKESFGPLDNR
jgi:hypothetical protein